MDPLSSRLENLLKLETFREVEYWGSEWVLGAPSRDEAMELLFRKGIDSWNGCMLIGCGGGALANLTASPTRQSWVQHAFAEDESCFKKQMSSPENPWVSGNIADWLVSGTPVGVEKVFFRIFQDMEWNHQILDRLAKDLAPGTEIQILGRKKDGISSLEKRIQKAWGRVDCLHVGSHSRWIATQIPLQATLLNRVQGGDSVKQNWSVPEGVFAAGKLDVGTQLLLECTEEQTCKGKRVWDLGCGAGWLAAKALEKQAEYVLATDHSFWASHVTRQNLSNGAWGPSQKWDVRCTFLDDGIEDDFDIVLTNPPFHLEAAQKENIGRLWVKACAARLKKGGEILLVCNSFLPYEQFCTELGLGCERLKMQQGFTVYAIQV